MKCYYEVLSVSRESEESEIKSAYKKLALKWHPDKNPDSPEEAKEQFQLVQQAYEVLSDRQERAWYDNHREQILRGSDKDFEDNSLDVFLYFTSSCFKGYGDDKKGFYTVYRTVFEELAKEDLEYMDNKDEFCNIPMFGNSTSDYDMVVGPFYNYWLCYSTKKSYVWLDPYDLREARERRVLKLIEKENKKVRIQAKKERNEEVRNLVHFVHKRDKRVQEHAKLLEAKSKENKQKQEELSQKRRMERRKEINESGTQAEWTKFDNVQCELKEIEKSLAEQFGEELSCSDSDEEEFEDNNLYCVACNKVFKTPKAFENHELSKKHKSNVDALKDSMLEDDVDFEESEPPPEPSEDEFSEESLEDTISKPNKQRKSKKILSVESEEEVTIDVINNVEIVDEAPDVDPSKKQKKKAKKKNKKPAEANGTPTVIMNNDDETEDRRISKKRKEKSKTGRRNGNFDDDSVDKDHCCMSCKSKFDSKNKLFEHLKKTGHSIYIPKAQSSNIDIKKRGIK